ncbi:MAG: gliding motility lipoprotein GldB [Saonia sp.]
MKLKEDYFRIKSLNFIVLTVLWFFYSCGDGDKVNKDIAKIDIDLKIVRFDKEFAKASPLDIPLLKKTYPYLFPVQYTDSVWEAKLVDTLQLEIREEVDKTFIDFKDETADLEQLFKRIKYFFPNLNVPKVITLTNDVDYNNRVVFADTLLFIGLDNYLGHGHRFYAGMQNYIASGLDRQFLISDVAGEFARKVISRPKDRSFLSQLVYHGKELFIKDKLIPFETDAQKMGYSEDQLAWAQANEQQIWRYFIERELLYSTDAKLAPRFLDPAPFSKFRLELDNESPGGVGRYIGWQIVRAFMANNNLSLQQMLNLRADEIFKKANYKPKKE